MDTLLPAVQGENWRVLGRRIFPGEYHQESHQWIFPKLYAIEQQYESDNDCLRAVVECWVQRGGSNKELSWRDVVWTLDHAYATNSADNMRHFAEPVLGKSYLSINVSTFLCSM